MTSESPSIPPRPTSPGLYNEVRTIFGVQGGAGVILAVVLVYDFVFTSHLPVVLYDALFNLFTAVTGFASLWLLLKHKAQVIWVSGLTLLACNIYSFAVGRGLNWIFSIFQIVMILCIAPLIRRKQLA